MWPRLNRLQDLFGSGPIEYNHPDNDNVGFTFPLGCCNHTGTAFESPYDRCGLVPEPFQQDADRASMVRTSRSHRWRRRRYQSWHVGRGRACYARVCEAALSWEFGVHAHPTCDNAAANDTNISKDLRGMCRIPSSLPNTSGSLSTNGKLLSEHVRKVECTMSCLCQRYVTFTSVKLPLLPLRIWALNPVSVIYNVGEHGANSTTWITATAYATQRGHWLCGEERVAVRWRRQQQLLQQHDNKNDDETGPVDVEILSMSRPGALMGWLLWPVMHVWQQRFFEQQLRHFNATAKAAE